MKAEQPTILCKKRRSNRCKPLVVITDRSMAVLLLRFLLFYVRCCSICLILTLLCFQFIYSVWVTVLPPVWERVTNTAYHL